MPDRVGHDEKTMDKIIEKKTGWRVAFTKKALPWWLGALLLAFVIYLFVRPNNKTLRVDKDIILNIINLKSLSLINQVCLFAINTFHGFNSIWY